jgi:hypothetical protein
MAQMKTPLIIILVSVLLASFGMASDKSGRELHFKAELSGNEEVPAVKTQAKGEAKFYLRKGEDRFTYSVVLRGIENITAAHIHKGKKGENGPPVVDLFKEPRGKTATGTLLSEGVIFAYDLIGPLKGKSLKSLEEMMETEDAYVNVHSKDHPEGEIRGQIIPGIE